MEKQEKSTQRAVSKTLLIPHKHKKTLTADSGLWLGTSDGTNSRTSVWLGCCCTGDSCAPEIKEVNAEHLELVLKITQERG